MEKEIKKTEKVVGKAPTNMGKDKTHKAGGTFKPRFGDRPRQERRGFGERAPRAPKPHAHLFTKVLSVDRVGKTNTGGKVISFSAFSVVGDESGSVGVGLGKAKEVSAAVEKSKNLARKNMFTLPMKNLDTIPHNVYKKYCGTRVYLMKGKKGHIASNLAKNIFKAAGLKNMGAKALGARSIKNTAYAIIDALKSVESTAMIAERRNLKEKELLNRQKSLIYYGLLRQNGMHKQEKIKI
jgi:small subunit ribosomal protein S5